MTAAPVVTGMGVVAPTGLGTEAFWAATLRGEQGIERVRSFDASSYPSRLAGEVYGFDPSSYLPGRLIAQTDRVTQLALVVADWALQDAGVDLDRLDPYACGVVTASTCGGFEFGQNELQALWSRGSEYVSAYQSFAWFYAVNTGQISIRHGLRGPSSVVVADQAGGLDALDRARRSLRDGAGLMIAGGMEAAICPWGWAAHIASGRMSNVEDPRRAYLPFDVAASGHVVGEGGALLVLEDPEAARARGCDRFHGVVLGYGSTIDPAPELDRSPHLGAGLRAAIELALGDAGLDHVDVVFADGAGLDDLDRAEASALRAAFGARAVPVTIPKTATGRLGAGAGPVDVAVALLALRDGVIPPTVGVQPRPDLDLDLVVDRARPAELRHALVLARGAGGFNSALVLGAAEHVVDAR